ncbi:MAG: SlyX family protein [Puniceicoccales bacterium]
MRLPASEHSANFPAMPTDHEERFNELEARIAYLERHLEQQDREMLKQAERITLLTRELSKLKGRVDDGLDGSSMPAQERPPHY